MIYETVSGTRGATIARHPEGFLQAVRSRMSPQRSRTEFERRSAMQSYCATDRETQVMDTVTVYKGHKIVPLCSAGPPYAAKYQITLPGGRKTWDEVCPGAFQSESEAFACAIEAAKKRINNPYRHLKTT